MPSRPRGLRVRMRMRVRVRVRVRVVAIGGKQDHCAGHVSSQLPGPAHLRGVGQEVGGSHREGTLHALL